MNIKTVPWNKSCIGVRTKSSKKTANRKGVMTHKNKPSESPVNLIIFPGGGIGRHRVQVF